MERVKRKKVNIQKDDTLDSIIFGKISFEKYVDYLGNSENRIGGPIVYAESTCASCKDNVAIITKLSEQDKDILKVFEGINTNVISHYDNFTQETKVHISNVTPYKDEVFYNCLKQNSPFTKNDIPNLRAYNYIFLEGAQGDYDVELIKECSTRGKVALDASSFICKINPKTLLIENKDYNTIKQLLPYCDYVLFNQDQLRPLTDMARTKDACEVIKSLGAKEVLVSRNNVLCLLDNNYNYREERIAESLNLNRAYLNTTTFVSYVNHRITSDPINALYCACAIGTIKLKRPGPLLCNRVEIDHILKFFYYYKPIEFLETVPDDI